MSDDKPEEKDIETERKQSPLDEYRYKVDTGGAILRRPYHPDRGGVAMGKSRHHRRRQTKRKRRMCTDKKKLGSEYAAMRVGARYGQDWYRCPYCHRWHLTSKNTQPGERHG